jgi:glyoxylase I family protein
VRDLDAMVEQLQGAGIDVVVDQNAYPNGRFAQLHDPEGNPVQLWQELS